MFQLFTKGFRDTKARNRLCRCWQHPGSILAVLGSAMPDARRYQGHHGMAGLDGPRSATTRLAQPGAVRSGCLRRAMVHGPSQTRNLRVHNQALHQHATRSGELKAALHQRRPTSGRQHGWQTRVCFTSGRICDHSAIFHHGCPPAAPCFRQTSHCRCIRLVPDF